MLVWQNKAQQSTNTPSNTGRFFCFMDKKKKILIAGPCALESREQMIETITQAKKLAVDFVRLSLWKPRTKPGFEGIGEEGIPLLVEATKMGVNPGVEPLVPSQAEKVVNAVLPVLGNGKL